MTDDHEDYLEEGAAEAHAATHQNGGDDEMSVAGLEGETAELAIHAGLATVHQDAPNLILTHKGDAGAHHAKYTDGEAVTAMGALGDANPLNHDKAAEWGATEHTAIGDGAPHHAKYTDGEASKFVRNLVVSNWTSRTSAADNDWYSVCWSPELTLFVAVAYSGTGNRVMTSPDGINWTSRTSAADNEWLSVCWSPELTLFVAVARTGTGNRVMTSLFYGN